MINFRWKIMGRLGNNLFQFAYLYAQVKEGKIPDIYLQSDMYFEKYSQELKTLLSEGIGNIDKVAIHVRRGDYVNNSFYVDLMADGAVYYKQAMNLFPHEEFLVFSDDIEWCKKQPIFENCSFSEGFSEEDDMNRMASCNGHIISNSSFSWWGAYLSPHEKRVIAPSRWYADGVQRTHVPDKWIQL